MKIYENVKYSDDYNLCLGPIDKDITVLKLHPKTKIIEFKAFEDCKNLKEVDFPSDFTTLRYNCFKGCTSLKNINLKDTKVTIIPRSSFYLCTKLENVSLNENIEIIGTSAFFMCKNLKSLNLPKNLHLINETAFYGCKSLKDLDFENTCLEKIDRDAFKACDSFTKIVLPETLVELCSSFYGCKNLKFADLSKTKLKTITCSLFNACENLENILLPTTAETIYSNIITGSKIKELNLLNTDIKYIEYAAFENCKYLEKVILPKNLIRLSDEAFRGTKVESIFLPKSLKFGTRFVKYSKIKNIYYEELDEDYLKKLTKNPINKTRNIICQNLESLLDERKTFKEINTTYKTKNEFIK